MTPPSKPPAPFDAHAADYEAGLMRGIRLSGESKEYFARGRLAWLREWWTRDGRPEPGFVLDWGCGPGDVSALLSEIFPGARVLGVDPSRQQIERARSAHASARVDFAERGAPEDARAGGADLIHLNGVIHHVAPAERPSLYAELRERLAPGGALGLFENNPINPVTRLAMARIPFDRDAVPISARAARRGLAAAGLRPVATAHLFLFPRLLAGLRPLERPLRWLPLGAQYGVVCLRDARETPSRPMV